MCIVITPNLPNDLGAIIVIVLKFYTFLNSRHETRSFEAVMGTQLQHAQTWVTLKYGEANSIYCPRRKGDEKRIKNPRSKASYE